MRLRIVPFGAGLVVAGIVLAGASASAETLRIPRDFPTLQTAVDAAAPGDEIRLARGRWCGARIAKRLHLVGEGGATIIGCATPTVAGRPAGLLYDTTAGSPASGGSVRNLTFDGAGLSSTNASPLAFALFARDVHGLEVSGNTVLGTVQAITNTRGSGWNVHHNVISGLTVLPCSVFCGGGVGIVFQQRTTSAPRAVNNEASFNVVTGAVPDYLNEFSMAAILLIGQDGGRVTNNRITLPDNPVADGAGVAIDLSDACCGNPAQLLTTINSVVVNNDARDSEYAVVIWLDSNGGTGNSVGTTVRGNFGVNLINDDQTTVTNRSKATELP